VRQRTPYTNDFNCNLISTLDSDITQVCPLTHPDAIDEHDFCCQYDYKKCPEIEDDNFDYARPKASTAQTLDKDRCCHNEDYVKCPFESGGCFSCKYTIAYVTHKNVLLPQKETLARVM
jgi:hypothetical protein